MDIVVTNRGATPIPIGSTKAGGFLDPLNPGEPYSIVGSDFTVVTIGDEPSFREQLAEALQNILAVFERIVTFWREREQADETAVTVNVTIENHGSNDVRVILGNNSNDAVLVSGNTREYSSLEYIEVRELGV